MIDKFIGLSGLPRSGSTLLSAILDQNPAIHAEGNSAVCQLMWDMQQSCYGAANEQLHGSNRLHTIDDIIASIPDVYYKDIKANIIIDKCRVWPMQCHMRMLAKHFKTKPKIIILERSIIDVMKSFTALQAGSVKSITDIMEAFMHPHTPVVRALEAINLAKQHNNGEFLFITYDELVDNTQSVLNSIYEFCEIVPFKHDLLNIINNFPENDIFHDAVGMHGIRPTIGRRKNDVVLPDHIMKRCEELRECSA